MNRARLEKIRAALETEFAPELLDVEDESHLHVGHAGARDGRGHFRVMIVADAFDGLTRIQRHRLIYAALASLLETDIHALSLEVRASSEM